MIKDQTLNEIHNLELSEVISDYIELKRDGAQFSAYSPFTDENTPSFKVSDSKGVWKDFSTGESSKSTIDFVMQYRNLSFPEAVKEICHNHGISYQETEDSEQQKAENQERQEIIIANNFAADFYHNQLPQHKTAIDYFYKLGLTDDTIQKYQLGHAPKQNAFYQEAVNKQYSVDTLYKASLIGKNDKEEYYDFFRDRLIFPVHNKAGKVAGFAGRTIEDKENSPKYINSKDTKVYNKSKLFYGLYQAKKAMLQNDMAIIVEGYTDVLKVHQDVRQDVIATCGTAFTDKHAYYLAKIVNTVVFCYDGDNAGYNAVQNSLEYALKEGLDVKVALLPEGKDPDELIREQGPEAMHEVLSTAKDGIIYYAEQLAQQSGEDYRKKGRSARLVMNQVKLIPDVNAQYYYVNDLARVLGLDKAVLKEQIKASESEQKQAQTNDVTAKKFWIESENKKTGQKNLSVDYVNFFQFLQEKGYHLYSIDNDYTSEESSQFIHLNGKIATPTNPLNISHETLKYLKNKGEKDAENMMLKGVDRYFSKNRLKSGLSYPDNLKFNDDTEDTTYLYFSNCFVKITETKIETHPYEELHSYIWRSHMRNHEFEYKDDVAEYKVEGLNMQFNSDFAKFIWLASTGKGGRKHWPRDNNGKLYNPTEQELEVDNTDFSKFYSFMTAIGYLVTSYKNPSEAPAIVAVDSKQPVNGEPNGRTGKSLLGNAISQIIKMVTIDARNFKFDDVNAWENVNLDTKVIMFNDTPPKFPFDRLFGMITEGMYVKKMYGSRFFIPFDKSPKFYINTNYVLKGEGESNLDRQFIIEFTDYFSSQWRPEHEFGRSFFYDWDTDEWNRFYTFIAHCVKAYMESGLHPFPVQSYEYRKLIDKITEEAFDFFESYIELNVRYPKRDIYGEMNDLKEHGLYDEFVRQYPDFKQLSVKKFTQWYKAWAGYNQLAINEHVNGERDRVAGHDYVTFNAKNE